MIAQPDNNQCVGSYQVDLGVPIDGNNIGATFDYVNQIVCGSRSDGKGVWYVVMGNGKSLTASVCSASQEQAHFGVFNQCNGQDCNGYADPSRDAKCFNDEVTAYSWQSANESSYFIHIRGLSDVDFRLIVTEEATAENDKCSEADEVTLGYSVEGSTTGSSFDFLNANACGIGTDLPGVWYLVNGNGRPFTATVCSKTSEPIDFGVFNECNSRSCLGHSNYKVAMCDNDDSVEYSWNTQLGSKYLIHIRSPGDSEFLLKVVPASNVSNNRCLDSTPIELDTPVNGDNHGTTFDFVDDDLCGSGSDLAGLWYVIRGDGYEYDAFVCSNGGGSVYFAVFDECDSSSCIGSPTSSIRNCTEESSPDLSFHTFNNAKYYIHIRGDVGIDFNLTVSRSGGTLPVLGMWTLAAAILVALM